MLIYTGRANLEIFLFLNFIPFLSSRFDEQTDPALWASVYEQGGKLPKVITLSEEKVCKKSTEGRDDHGYKPIVFKNKELIVQEWALR